MDTWQRRAVAVPEPGDARPFVHEPCAASAMVTGAQLAVSEMLVEVQATAVRP